MIEHNHKWFEPANDGTNLLFHPDCDPRILQNSCPACKEYMRIWGQLIQSMIERNA